MKNNKNITVLICAIACIAIGVFFKAALVGYSFLAYGFWAIAVVILVLLGLTYYEKKEPQKGKKIKKIIYMCIFFFCIALIVTEVIIVSDTKTDADGSEDYVVVLGAGVNGEIPSATLMWRMTAARDYLLENTEAVCIVSGGQGPGEDITEAECMYRWLTANGIDSSRVIKEERSSRTLENLTYSKEIMDELSDGEEYRAAIVSSDFHICRAKTLAYRLGMDVTAVSAGTEYPVLMVNYYFREAFALWNMMIFD